MIRDNNFTTMTINQLNILPLGDIHENQEDTHDSQPFPSLQSQNITMNLAYRPNYQLYCSSFFVIAVNTKEIKILKDISVSALEITQQLQFASILPKQHYSIAWNNNKSNH